MARISMKFGTSAEEQAFAHKVVSALREGDLERESGKRTDTLLFGLPWHRLTNGRGYYALHWNYSYEVRRAGRAWEAVQLIGAAPSALIGTFKSMREAREACEDVARRTPRGKLR